MPNDPTPYATADIETDPFKKGGRYPNGRFPVAFMSCFFDGKLSTIYEGKTECCSDLVRASIDFGGIVFLHSGGKFDLHFLINFLLVHYDYQDLKFTCIGPRIVALKTPTCEFRDSYALIPKALKSLKGAAKIDIQFWKLEEFAEDLAETEAKIFWEDIKKRYILEPTIWPSPREFYHDEIAVYLRQDCKGLYDEVSNFIELYGRNLTLASAAFSVLKKQFGMPVVHTRVKYDDCFRRFYFAGRVQFWALGRLDGPYKILDINSAFPAAMMHNHWFSSGYTVTDSYPTENPENSFYEIECNSKGALPLRTKEGIVFPEVERGHFFATGWELLAGQACGLVSDVSILRCYSPKGVRNFADYVSHFYALKKEAKSVSERDFAKLFLNSAYGKFSQNVRNFSEVCCTKFREHSAEHMQTLGWEHSYDDENRGLSFYQKPTYQADGRDSNGRCMRFYNVCTAASITGWVRAFLMRSMGSCRGVVYCDTDSVIALDTSRLELGDAIGQWKQELECDRVYIGGKKLYAARNKHHETCDEKSKWKKASKGVRLTVDQICKVCEGEAQSYSFEAPNYSVFSRPRFTTRKVQRDDKRKSA